MKALLLIPVLMLTACGNVNSKSNFLMDVVCTNQDDEVIIKETRSSYTKIEFANKGSALSSYEFTETLMTSSKRSKQKHIGFDPEVTCVFKKVKI